MYLDRAVHSKKREAVVKGTKNMQNESAFAFVHEIPVCFVMCCLRMSI